MPETLHLHAPDPLTDELATWLSETRAEMRLAHGSASKYHSILSALVGTLKARGVASWDAVTRADVLAHNGRLVEAGASAATLCLVVTAERRFARWRHLSGRADSDFMRGIERPRRSQPAPKALTQEQVATLLDSPWSGPFPERDRAILETLYATGARNGELRALSLGDVDLAQGVVRLFGKGGRGRPGYLTPAAIAALEQWLSVRVAIPGEPALFVGHRGTRLTDMGLWMIVQRRATACGLPRIHPHMLRHSFCTHLMQHGAGLRAIQAAAGHASIQSTQVYLRADDPWVREQHHRYHPRRGHGSHDD